MPTSKIKTTDIITESNESLGESFENLIDQMFGNHIPPGPKITPIGILPIDAILGGGFISSSPIMISSTPETGKSTLAFQICKSFLNTNKDGIVVYIDIESTTNNNSTKFQISRSEQFGLNNTKRFIYRPFCFNVMEVFEFIASVIQMKKNLEDKHKKEIPVLIVWDSVAATTSSKTDKAEDPNQIIGTKARQLSFCLDKYIVDLKFNKITLLSIDQVRAKISMEGPYVQKEQSTGTFKDFRAATNIAAYQHSLQQWMWLSKGPTIIPTDSFGIDGWYMNIMMEKNKLAPSKIALTVVFDKRHGIDKFWSEYIFMFDYTPSEKKFYRTKKPPFELPIIKSGNKRVLRIVDGNKIYWESAPFWEKDAKEYYITNDDFRKAFDGALQLSVKDRIINGMFNQKENEIANGSQNISTSDPASNANLEVYKDGMYIDKSTGNVYNSDGELQLNINTGEIFTSEDSLLISESETHSNTDLEITEEMNHQLDQENIDNNSNLLNSNLRSNYNTDENLFE